MRIVTFAPLILSLSLACSTSTSPPTDRVSISVAALSLTGVADATWTLTVRAGTGPDAPLVWTKTLHAQDFGSAAAGGSFAYVGPCDASVDPNVVSLHLDALSDASGTPLPYVDPGVLVQSATCKPNADTAVDFAVTIARPASQGFFDVAVTFDDVFCSAKLDCKGDDGQPLMLLHDPDTDARGPTMVAAWACTSGSSQPTYMHMSALTLECDDGTRIVHVPSQGPGNVGGDDGDYVFQRAVYRVEEQLDPYTKCGWNHAIGLDLTALQQAGVSCTLRGEATASAAPFEQGKTPVGAVYPYIVWDVPVIDHGALVCGQEPLDQSGDHVATHYTNGQEQHHFAYTMTCAEGTPVALNGYACGGQVAGFTDPVVVAPTSEGVVVSIGGHTSAPLPLPQGIDAVVQDCCIDPCCTAP